MRQLISQISFHMKRTPMKCLLCVVTVSVRSAYFWRYLCCFVVFSLRFVICQQHCGANRRTSCVETKRSVLKRMPILYVVVSMNLAKIVGCKNDDVSRAVRFLFVCRCWWLLVPLMTMNFFFQSPNGCETFTCSKSVHSTNTRQRQ